MSIAVCVTTMNRTKELEACLNALWQGKVKPVQVIVSDDSVDMLIQDQNRNLVSKYPSTSYIKGPHQGISANRNNALDALNYAEFVAFTDDDVCVNHEFLSLATAAYLEMGSEKASRTILSGASINQFGHAISITVKLSFRGYFKAAKKPEAVILHAAIFPMRLLKEERWDPYIYYGYEDAELCLRALKRGYSIICCPQLQVSHTKYGEGTLDLCSHGRLSESKIYSEGARLYVGIKRYAIIFPNPVYLIAFVCIYFIHLTVFLSRHGSLNRLPQVLACSNVDKLLHTLIE